MIGEKLLEKRPVSLAEVKELISERKKDKDLSYEQDLTAKYAKRFAKVSLAQAKKLESDLKEIEGLNEELVVKIIDILPEKKEKLFLLMPKEVVLGEASLLKIVELCKKHRK